MSRPEANSSSGNGNNNATGMQEYQMASMQYYSANIAAYGNTNMMGGWNYSNNYGYSTAGTSGTSGTSGGLGNQYAAPATPTQYGSTLESQNSSGTSGGGPGSQYQQYYNMQNMSSQYPPLMNYSLAPPPPPPPPQGSTPAQSSSSFPQAGNNSFPQTQNNSNKFPQTQNNSNFPQPQKSSGYPQPGNNSSFPQLGNNSQQQPTGLPGMHRQPLGTSMLKQHQKEILQPPPPPPPPPPQAPEVIEPITISCPPMPPTFPWVTAAMYAPLAACDLKEPELPSPVPNFSNNYGNEHGNEHHVPGKKNFREQEDQQIKSSNLQRTDPIDPTLPVALKNMFQPLFCKLCNLSLSSAIVASDHYKGKRHKKNIENWLVDNPDAPRVQPRKPRGDEGRSSQNSSAPPKWNAHGGNPSKNEISPNFEPLPFRNGPSKNDPIPPNFPRNSFQENRPNDFRPNEKRAAGNFSDNQSSTNSNANPGGNQWNRNEDWSGNDQWNRNNERSQNKNAFAGNERQPPGQSRFNGELSEWNPTRGGNNRWSSNNSQASFRSASPASDSGSSSRFGENSRNKPGWRKRDGDFGGRSNQTDENSARQNNAFQPKPLMSVEVGTQPRFPATNGGPRGNANVQGGNDSRKPFQNQRPFQGKGGPFQDQGPFQGKGGSFQDKEPLFQQSMKRPGGNAIQAPPAKKDKNDFKGGFANCEVCNIVLNSKSSADQHFAGKRHRDNLLNHQKTGQFDHVDRSFGIGSSFRNKQEQQEDLTQTELTDSKSSADPDGEKIKS